MFDRWIEQISVSDAEVWTIAGSNKLWCPMPKSLWSLDRTDLGIEASCKFNLLLSTRMNVHECEECENDDGLHKWHHSDEFYHDDGEPCWII